MRKKCVDVFGVLAVLFFLVAPGALAHEFIVKPATMTPHADQVLPLSVLSAHIFMVSEEMEPAEQVVLSLVKGKDVKSVPIVKNPTLMTLDAAVTLENKGSYLLCGHRKGVIWTNTGEGWKQTGKKGLKNVVSSGKYEKFCKTLISVDTPDKDTYRQIVGHDLEIVPLDDPASLVPENEGRFKVLFKGKPLAATVYASYDGFSSRPNTWAYMTETDENGVAYVKFHHPGTWMIRVENKIDQPTEDYDLHVMRSVLVFDVK